MPSKSCRVTVRDIDGTSHTAEVTANSLFEAVAQGLAALRRSEWVEGIGTLNSYFEYYHRSRTHLSLAKDAPEPRPIEPPEMGLVVAVPQVGGLHHRYQRRAA